MGGPYKSCRTVTAPMADEWKRRDAEHDRLHGPDDTPWVVPYCQLPQHGLSPEILAEQREFLAENLKDMREFLALGDIAAVEYHILLALSTFNIDLDRTSAAYPKLGMEVLRAHVRALQAIEQRNAGEASALGVAVHRRRGRHSSVGFHHASLVQYAQASGRIVPCRSALP